MTMPAKAFPADVWLFIHREIPDLPLKKTFWLATSCCMEPPAEKRSSMASPGSVSPCAIPELPLWWRESAITDANT